MRGFSRNGFGSQVTRPAEVCPGGEYQNSLFGIESFRPDGIHFSNAGKVWLGKWLGEELTRRCAEGEWDKAVH